MRKDAGSQALRFLKIVGLVGLVLPAGTARAQTGGLSFERNYIEVPDEGVRVMFLRGANPVALPPPDTYRYRSNHGDVLEKFRPRELWYPTQYRGRWEDGTGNALILGALREPFPAAFQEEHVSREDYEQARQGGRPVQTSEQIRRWLEDFAGAPMTGQAQRLADSVRLQHVYAVAFEGHPQRVGYLFSVRPNVHGVDPNQRFFALFELSDHTDLPQARRDIERHFLSSVDIIPQGELEQATASARMQDAAAAEQIERTPAYEASREAVINSIRGLNRWWFVETPHYILVSDLTGRHRSFVQTIQTDLETLRGHFSELTPAPRPASEVSVVRLFGDRDDYLRYVGKEYEWSGGLWMPIKKELVIRPADVRAAREQRETMMATIYHEAFHQYLHYAFDGLRVCPWFNEGHATYFEGASITPRGLVIQEVDWRRRQLDNIIRARAVDLGRILQLSYAAFYEQGGDESRRRANYTLSWALIYYLRRGAATNPDNAYETIPERYTAALVEYRDGERATAETLPPSSIPDLTEDFLHFWSSSSRQKAAQRTETR